MNEHDVQITWLGLCLACFVVGCTDRGYYDIDDHVSRRDIFIDLGQVITEGQTIEKRIPVSGLTVEDKLFALRPCCSTIRYAEDDDRRAEGFVDVTWTMAPQDGQRKVEFSITHADRPERPRRLTLLADLKPAVDLDIDGFQRRLAEGRDATFTVTVTLNDPEVDREENLELTGVGPLEVVDGDGKTFQIRQRPQPSAGRVSATFIGVVNDEVIFEEPLSWEVTPLVRADPSTVLVREPSTFSQFDATLTADEPFSIQGVYGASIVDHKLDWISDQTCRLQVEIDPDRLSTLNRESIEVIIRTTEGDLRPVEISLIVILKETRSNEDPEEETES